MLASAGPRGPCITSFSFANVRTNIASRKRFHGKHLTAKLLLFSKVCVLYTTWSSEEGNAAMNCQICSINAQTVTTWNGKQPEHGKLVIYSVWECEQGHHFYTQSKWDGLRYKTEFVNPQDMQFFKTLL